MENSISSDLIRGHIDTIILCTLVVKDKFPNEISQEINEKTEGSYQINQATLYSSLKRLESLKHVTSYWHDADVGGRRKYYHLTEEGKAAIEENSSSWDFSRKIIDRLVHTDPNYVTQISTQNDKQNADYLQNIELQNVKLENQRLLNEITELKNRAPEIQVKTVYVKDPDFGSSESKNFITQQSNAAVSKPVIRTKPVQTAENNDSDIFSINYRDVLGDIINSSKVVFEYPKKEEDTVKHNTISQFVEEQQQEVKLPSNKTYSGQMDYTDLTEKLASEGFKLRVSRQSTRPVSSLQYINKMKFTSVLFVYFIFLIELLMLSFFASDVLGLKLWHYLVIFAVSLVVPFGAYFTLKDNFSKYSSAMHAFKDPLIVASIVLFNCALLDVTMIILFEINLTNVATLFYALIIPIVILIDILFYFVSNYILYNKRVFRV